MKKAFAKFLALVMAVTMVFTLSIGASCMDGEYFSTVQLENYVEEDITTEDTLQSVGGTHTETMDYYIVTAYEEAIEGFTAQDLYDNYEYYDYESDFKADLEENLSEYKVDIIYYEMDVESTEKFEYVVIECGYSLSDDIGIGAIVYEKWASIPAETYLVDVGVSNADSREECEKVFYDVLENLTVYGYVGNTDDGYMGGLEDFEGFENFENMEQLEDMFNIFNENQDEIKELAGVSLTVILVVMSIMVIVPIIIIIIVIVAIVKSSKKKKQQQQQAQQQYNQYNQYGYNPYGQQPPQNNGYNPYGQQPPQNNGYTPSGYTQSDYNPYSNNKE